MVVAVDRASDSSHAAVPSKADAPQHDGIDQTQLQTPVRAATHSPPRLVPSRRLTHTAAPPACQVSTPVSAAPIAAERPRLKLAEQQEGYISHIGPVYETQLAGGWRRVLPLDRRHLGADGTVHGGAISAFADFVAWRAIADTTNGTPPRVAPIQTSLQYLGVAKSGQWLYGEGLLLKQSQGLYHVTVELFTAERSVATASTLWKAFR